MTSQQIEFESKNSSCPGYLCQGNGLVGAVVIQEWWGVNEQIREHACNISKMSGFTTIVPDLYRSEPAIDREEAGHKMNGLNWEGAYEDIMAAGQFLKAQGCRYVFVCGFCMGGALTLFTLAKGGEVNQDVFAGGSAFYGIPGEKFCDVRKINTPVQLHIGEKDELKGFSDVETLRATENKLKEGGVTYEAYVYQNAGHAFCHHSNEEAFNKDAYEHSHKRMIEFFKGIAKF